MGECICGSVEVLVRGYPVCSRGDINTYDPASYRFALYITHSMYVHAGMQVCMRGCVYVLYMYVCMHTWLDRSYMYISHKHSLKHKKLPHRCTLG